MNESSTDLSRRAATIIVAAAAALFFAVLFSCAGFGMPSRERMIAVYGAERFADSDIAWMTSGWKKLEASEGSSREILNAGGLYDTAVLSPREIDRIRALRRMALYTTEPDEMHVPLALGRMKPKQLDFNPHFFQYGGFFFYGCAVFVALAGVVGFVPLSGGLDSFIRDPALMAHFYLAAKMWTLLWCALLPLFVYRLARLGLSRKRALVAVALALSAPGLYIFGPVLKQVAMAASLSIASIWLACRLLRRARLRDVVAAGAAAGLAGATFPTQLVVLSAFGWVLVERALHDRCVPWKELLVGCAAAGISFIATNPYWIFDFRTVMNDAAVAMAWYKPDVNTATVARVLFEVLPAATGWPLAILGVLAIVAAIRNSLARSIAAPALAILLYYGWRITGVPDLGPFWSRQFLAIGPLCAVLIMLAWARAGIVPSFAGAAVAIALALPTAVLSVANFHRDATTESTRFVAGRWIDANIPAGETIYVTQQPGPFSTPFFNLNAHPVKPAAAPDSMPMGAIAVSVAMPNDYGNDTFFAAMKLEKEFSSERYFLGMGPFPEAIGFANGPVRVWRRVR